MYKRDHKNLNEQRFLDNLPIQNWKNDILDANEKYNDNIWHLETCVNRHAPIKTLNKKKSKVKIKPWITSKEKLCIVIKKKSEDEQLKTSYNKFRNSITILKSKKRLSLILLRDIQTKYEQNMEGYKSKKQHIFNNFFVNVGPKTDKTIPNVENIRKRRCICIITLGELSARSI